ncbi:MFS multidrug transporter [Aspergillus sp. HF37]|nr:MFS multidrug transporter [Aspergillus sp. HF37]
MAQTSNGTEGRASDPESQLQGSKGDKEETPPTSRPCLGPDDPENPQNWPLGKKWAATMVVSGFTFMSRVSSSMVAPAVSKLGEELDMSTKIEVQLALSIFVLRTL